MLFGTRPAPHWSFDDDAARKQKALTRMERKTGISEQAILTFLRSRGLIANE